MNSKVRKNCYEIDGVAYPRVTSVCNLLAKPGLPRWFGKITAEYMRDRVKDHIKNLQGDENIDKDTVNLEAVYDYLNSLDLKQLVRNAKNAPDKEKNAKAESGKDIHGLIEKFLINGKEPPGASVNLYWESFTKFWAEGGKSRPLIPLEMEKTVYSKEYGYAGTLDLFAYMEGLPTIIDWKTSKSIWGNYWYQLASYTIAREEMKNDKIQKMGIVRLQTNGDFEFQTKDRKDINHYFEIFLHLCELWHLINRGKSWPIQRSELGI